MLLAPHVDVWGDCWSFTTVQAQQLQVVHSDCLRQTLNAKLCECHSLIDIRQHCGIVSLADLVKAGRLRWLGHVLRMEEDRLPKQTLWFQLNGAVPARRGRPRIS